MRRNALAAALAVASLSCTGDAERPIVAQFFAASRLADRTALADVATVMFDPRTSGTVLSFRIETVSSDTRQSPQERGIPIKNVFVNARLHLPGGEIVQKRLILTLERFPSATGVASARWKVTAFREASAPSAAAR